MFKTVECDSCGVMLGAFQALGPKPVGREICPKCGGREFNFV